MGKSIPKHVQVAERRRRNVRLGVLEELESIFGPPPLLDGEDELAYLDLVQRIRAAFKPQDVIDEMFARDVADLSWEMFRLRRVEANIRREAWRRAALQLIRSRDPEAARMLDQAKNKFDQQVGLALRELGLTEDQVQAQALLLCLADVERVEAMLDRTERRRNMLFREFDRRKEAAQRLKLMCETLAAAPPKLLPAP